MNCNPARPKEDCLGKACQQAEQGALHSADAIRPSPEPSKLVTAFSSHSALSAETIVCVRARFSSPRKVRSKEKMTQQLPARILAQWDNVGLHQLWNLPTLLSS